MTKKYRWKRRDFLTTTAAAVGAPYVIPEGVLASNGQVGANDRVRVGHIGFGGRSRGLYRELGLPADDSIR